jgi:hypothetical protein
VILPRILIHAYLLMSTAALLVGCDEHSLDTTWRSGSYRLEEIDAREQMTLFEGDSSVGIVGPTIFSIGADDRHIVLKQHPNIKAKADFDRSVTRYFIVDRGDGKRTVHGPFNVEEFNKLSVSQSLPAFTKTFKDLE